MKRLAFSSGCVRVCIYMTLGGLKKTHEIRLSIDVSIGLVLIDLRKDARPGVNANELDGILSAQQGQLVCIESRRAQCDLDPDDSQPTKEKKPLRQQQIQAQCSGTSSVVLANVALELSLLSEVQVGGSHRAS